MGKQEINVRGLKAADAKRLVSLLGQEADLITDLQKAKSAENPEEAKSIATARIIQTVLGKHIDLLWEWIADLGNMTVEELDNAPIDTPMVILRGAFGSEEAQSFLAYVKSALPTDSKEDE